MPTNLFERGIISKKEKVLDQENSQLITQTLDFTQGLQSDVNALQTDVNTLQSEMDQAQTDINALPTQSDLNAKISDTIYSQTDWNGVTTIGASKNAIRDKLELIQSEINAHRHDGHTLECDGITSDSTNFTLYLSGVGQIRFQAFDVDDYIQMWTSSGIPKIGVIGGNNLYFQDNAVQWEIIHADDFTPHSAPLPIEMSTEKILLIKNVLDGSKLDYSSIPIDCYYSEKDGKNEGYKMNKMMLHLIKTIQELELRIKELEK